MTTQRRPLDLASMSVPEIIQKSLTDFTREDLYIGIPVVIKSTKDYETKQVVDVTPLINDEYRDDAIINAPTLKSIFVKIPNGGGFSIKLPIAVGDLATLHYTHRNISTFLDGFGAAVDVPIDMVADMKDCYVTHGFGTRNANQKPSKDNLVIEGDNSVITIKPSGEMSTVLPSTTVTILPDGTMTTITQGTALLKASAYTIDTDVTITGTLQVDKAMASSVSASAPNVVAATSLTVASKEMSGHTHPQGIDSNGDTQVSTGGPN
jgi:hypothetical protein